MLATLEATRAPVLATHLARQVGARAARLELLAEEFIETDAAGRVAEAADRPSKRLNEQRLEQLRVSSVSKAWSVRQGQ